MTSLGRRFSQEHKTEIVAITKELKTFGESSTVKGLPKLLKSQSLFLKVMWSAAIISGFGLSIWQCGGLAVQYLRHDSVTKLQYCSDCKAPFPDITLCNINPLNSLDDYSNQLVMTMDDFMDALYDARRQVERKWGAEDPTFSYYRGMTEPQLLEIFYEMFSLSGYFQSLDRNIIQSLLMVPGGKLITSCKWYGWDRKAYQKEDCMKQSIYTLYSPEYFVCYTLHINGTNVNSSNTEISSLFAMLYLNDFAEYVMRTLVENIYNTQSRGLRVLVHAPNTLPDMSKGFNIPPGHEIQIRIKAKLVTLLGKPFTECTHQDFLDSYEAKSSNVYHVPLKYTAKACQSLCLQEKNIKTCKCFNPHLPLSERLQKEHPDHYDCGTTNLLADDFDPDKVIDMVGCYLYNNTGFEDACDCPQACAQYEYDYQLLQSPWPHESYYSIFYSDKLRAPPYDQYFGVYQEAIDLFDAGNVTDGFKELKKHDLIERNFIQLKVLFQDEGHDVYTEMESMTFDAFIGNAGGILNLWIGITFFTFVEIADLVYNLISAEYKASKQQKTGPVDEKDQNHNHDDHMPTIGEEQEVVYDSTLHAGFGHSSAYDDSLTRKFGEY